MKKTIIILLLGITLIISGCSNNSQEKSVKQIETLDNNSTEIEDSNEKNNLSNNINISEQTIVDKNGIKVIAKSINYNGWLGPELKLLIENNTNNNITIQARDFSINGIMVDPTFSANVAAGKKANDTISFSNDELQTAKITAFKDFNFSLTIFDSNSWKDIFTQNDINLHTNAIDYVQIYNTDGTLAVDQNNIKIYVLKLDNKNSFWGTDIYVYIENNSTQNITVQARDVSINGFMVDPTFSANVIAGKKAYDSISFHESDLQKNDITSIDELELKFYVFNAKTWKDIFKTQTKKINF